MPPWKPQSNHVTPPRQPFQVHSRSLRQSMAILPDKSEDKSHNLYEPANFPLVLKFQVQMFLIPNSPTWMRGSILIFPRRRAYELFAKRITLPLHPVPQSRCVVICLPTLMAVSFFRRPVVSPSKGGLATSILQADFLQNIT